MASITRSDFGATTEGLTVAAAFPTAIKDRTIVITGINKLGIGYTTAEALASQAPRCLILAGRSTTKVQECISSLHAQYPNVDYRLLHLDLSSKKSVHIAATEVLSWIDTPTIDIVINNAGVMHIPTRTLSEDGIELHLATNHIGHFLFTNLVMSKLIAAAKASNTPGTTRIINISSVGTAISALRASDPNFTKPASQLPEREKPNFAMMRMAKLQVDEDMVYFPFAAYGQSKTANVLYSVGLNARLFEKHGILSVALHPGEIKSELQRNTDPQWLEGVTKYKEKNNMPWKTLRQGASTTLVAALDPMLAGASKSGPGGNEGCQTLFLSDCQIGKTQAYALDKRDAERLWGISEAWVGEKFEW